MVINAPTTTMKDEEIFGGGFFGKIKKGLSVANNFLKSTGAISKLGKYIPHVGASCVICCKLLGIWHSRIRRLGGTLNYSGGALNICGGQCVPGPALQVILVNNQKKLPKLKKDCFNLIDLFLLGSWSFGFGHSII